MDFLQQVFGAGDFMPHGYCYLWHPGLVWLHVISDSLIALSYFTIPFTLLWFVRKRRDLPFSWMFVLFGAFSVARGATHVMEVWSLWHGQYWLAGGLKAVTALASVATAILLVRLVPQALELPNLSDWGRANVALESEIHERRELEIDLRISESGFREQAELLDLTFDAVIVRNLRDEITYWNHRAEELYGWRAEEVLGKMLHELLQTVYLKALEEIDAETRQRGSWEGELTHSRRDGSVVAVSSRWVLRRDAPGNPNGILESNRDISAKREAEDDRNGQQRLRRKILRDAYVRATRPLHHVGRDRHRHRDGCGHAGSNLRTFFTTKETGKGTGLGLATVYGIVSQHDGFLQVYSEMNVGTTFRIYLPITPTAEKAPMDEEDTGPVRGGVETILIAEDHEGLRELARETLTNLGYDILLANQGEEAVRVFQANRDRIDLLLLDVVLPKINGPEAYARICAEKQDLPVIFTTGYCPEMELLHSAQELGLTVMQKPYVPSELARRVRETLHRQPAKIHPA
jgi:PAS domain S-box-containing protein